MASHVTQACIDLVKSFEGFTPFAVWDEKQYSYGYGTKADHEGQRISEPDAEIALRTELQAVDAQLTPLISNPNLTAAQWAALISAGYNLGIGNLTKNGIVADIDQGDLNAAAIALDSLCHAGGKFSTDLKTRRDTESGVLLGIKNFFTDEAAHLGDNVMGTASKPGTLSDYIAANFRGIKYVWGGKDADTQGGLDCSGFVSDVFKKCLNTTIDGAAKDMAGEIAGKFGLPSTAYSRGNLPSVGNIPMYAVISVTYPSGAGHVVMVMPDETGQPVVWESEGGSRNTANNPGKGVTKSSLASFLARMNREADSLTVTDTTKKFSGLKNGMLLTSDMMLDAWQADNQTKQQTLQQILANTTLGQFNGTLNFTNALGGYPFLNRSTFMTDANGQEIVNIAAGMSENWTKFSVIKNIANAHGMDADQALETVAAGDPAFEHWLEGLKDYGYGHQFGSIVAAMREKQLLGDGKSVAFAQSAADGAPNGRIASDFDPRTTLAAAYDLLPGNLQSQYSLAPESGKTLLLPGDQNGNPILPDNTRSLPQSEVFQVFNGETAQDLAERIMGRSQMNTAMQAQTVAQAGNIFPLFQTPTPVG